MHAKVKEQLRKVGAQQIVPRVREVDLGNERALAPDLEEFYKDTSIHALTHQLIRY